MTSQRRRGRDSGPSRRAVLAGSGAAGLALAAAPVALAQGQGFDFSGNPFRDRFQSFRQTFRVEPDPAEAQRILDAIVRGRPLRAGLVDMTAPDIAENGNVVPVSFTVNAAMTESDFPHTVHVLVMANPFPEIAKYHFTPACGAASLAFRCRMRATSDLVVVADMVDGSIGLAKRWVSVTLGACS